MDGSGGISHNFELSFAIRQVGGKKDFQSWGNPERPGSTSATEARARGAVKPESGVSASGSVATF